MKIPRKSFALYLSGCEFLNITCVDKYRSKNDPPAVNLDGRQ